jgi:hypothetical protein
MVWQSILSQLSKENKKFIYGQIKQGLGVREFLLRGIEKVKIEMNLVSIAQNLKKIHNIQIQMYSNRSMNLIGLGKNITM